ncbi:MAG TPA: NUDIX hydrolase [Flavobacteriaceae bacterium]|jgi:8-oxo-dGTP pyrophosphatase MutT (NUDIX family)|nr:NUDIX hydrolase [Flavobacteriaceae bacterium]HBS12944.1 NUDIX hydrolase [Flavobacteriaceae bacterium]
MITVFINDKPIYLTDSLRFETQVNFFKIDDVAVLELVQKMDNKNIETLYLYDENVDFIFEKFIKNFEVIKAAGGIVKNNKDEVLFIYRNDKWDLPKGKIEKNEAIREAAIREVEEETGVQDLQIEKPLENTYHIYNYKNTKVFKITYWFEMKTSFDGKLHPQLDEGITKVEWLNNEQLPKVFENTYANIKLLLQTN